MLHLGESVTKYWTVIVQHKWRQITVDIEEKWVDERCKVVLLYLTEKYSRSYALQTRLDLYNSKLALASSPVLFWNLCVQSEIWISIVICGLAAAVGQASKPPLSLLTWQLPAAQELHQNLSTPPSQYSHSLLYL